MGGRKMEGDEAQKQAAAREARPGSRDADTLDHERHPRGG